VSTERELKDLQLLY